MKTIRELIEKYEKENREILKKRPDLDLKGDFSMEGTVYFRNEVFIQDLKEYEKSIYQLPTDLNKCVEIHHPENYPPFRERLICAYVSGAIRVRVEDAIKFADEIINQLNQEK